MFNFKQWFVLYFVHFKDVTMTFGSTRLYAVYNSEHNLENFLDCNTAFS